MTRRIACLLLALAAVRPAAAQTAAPATVTFVPRYEFHLGAERLAQSDTRFVWDTNFGGSIDFVDYGVGRTTFTANYEAVLGKEFRSFDPNQGNYLLDLSSSIRAGGVEVAGILHHTSRHLSDRPKRFPVDWNMLGVTLRHDTHRGAVTLVSGGDVMRTILKSYVDYDWEANGHVEAAVAVTPVVSVVSRGNLRLVGVDGTRHRGQQRGARVEGGVRLHGTAGAVELLVLAERRVDGYPTEFTPVSWAGVGFRFVSR